MAKETIAINLLDNREARVTEQFLTWAVAIGRLLIILTEAIALSAFLYRFSIDRKIIDLNDKIKTSQAMVAQFKSGEDTYRKAQQKLLVTKSNATTTSQTLTLFDEIFSLADEGTTFTNLSVSRKKLEVSIRASTPAAISAFVQKLKDHPEIISVSIDKVENRTSNATISVAITAELKSGIGLPDPNAPVIPAEQQGGGL